MRREISISDLIEFGVSTIKAEIEHNKKMKTIFVCPFCFYFLVNWFPKVRFRGFCFIREAIYPPRRVG